MVKLASEIWRDHEVDGDPGTPPHQPIKEDVREWGTAQEESVANAAAGSTFGGGMLTLVPGTPVPSADVVGATALYFTPAFNDRIEIFNGSTGFINHEFSELSLTLNAASYGLATNFDAFVFMDPALPSAMRIGSFGWISGTDRGTGTGTTELELFDGRVVNKQQITLRNNAATYANVPARRATFVGSFRTFGAGSTEDSKLRRFVSNLYNISEKEMVRTEETTSWVYGTNTWREANNSGFNRLGYIHCVAGRRIDAIARSIMQNSTSTYVEASTGIGIDTNLVDSSQTRRPAMLQGGNPAVSDATWSGSPGLGFHEISWLEIGAGIGGQTQTHFGDSGLRKAGISLNMFN